MHHAPTIEDLYRRHHAPALRHLTCRYGRELAEDALADVWEVACRRGADEFTGGKAATFGAWLRLSAEHRIWHATGRDWRARLSAEHGGAVSLDDQLDQLGQAPADRRDEAGILDHLELVELIELLARIKPDRRVALICRMLGLSYQQAMEATGWTYTKINRSITEGRRELRGLLDEGSTA